MARGKTQIHNELDPVCMLYLCRNQIMPVVVSNFESVSRSIVFQLIKMYERFDQFRNRNTF